MWGKTHAAAQKLTRISSSLIETDRRKNDSAGEKSIFVIVWRQMTAESSDE